VFGVVWGGVEFEVVEEEEEEEVGRVDKRCFQYSLRRSAKGLFTDEDEEEKEVERRVVVKGGEGNL